MLPNRASRCLHACQFAYWAEPKVNATDLRTKSYPVCEGGCGVTCFEKRMHAVIRRIIGAARKRGEPKNMSEEGMQEDRVVERGFPDPLGPGYVPIVNVIGGVDARAGVAKTVQIKIVEAASSPAKSVPGRITLVRSRSSCVGMVSYQDVPKPVPGLNTWIDINIVHDDPGRFDHDVIFIYDDGTELKMERFSTHAETPLG